MKQNESIPNFAQMSITEIRVWASNATPDQLLDCFLWIRRQQRSAQIDVPHFTGIPSVLEGDK